MREDMRSNRAVDGWACAFPAQRPPHEGAKLRLDPSIAPLSLPGYLSRPCAGRRGSDSRCFE